MISIYSWNVNGLRAVLTNGFLDWFSGAQPDILCLQETRVLPEQVDATLLPPPGYQAFWNPAVKRGYSGTAVFTRLVPESVETLGVPEFDEEGRVQVLHFKDFSLVNTYWPNSRDERKRLPFKEEFCRVFTDFAAKQVEAGRSLVVCGDYNIAHTAIDLARPKQNENSAGYYIEEREAMSRFLDRGFADCFRRLHPDAVAYTWWSYRGNARANNVGWRIDYHCVNEAFLPHVRGAVICGDVKGSDHCPVALFIDPAPARKRPPQKKASEH